MVILSLRSLHKYYGVQHVVKNLELDIREGEFLTLLGPSGCGKTTTLRMIGGFEQPDTGKILLRGEDITHLPPYRRHVNTVFQNYALFPHLTVEQNVAFGLKQQKMSAADLPKRVNAMLEMVQMQAYARRKPQELSGGQQQRVAIARAVACDPDILLLDEPLGALDLKLRKQMQTELKNLHRELGKTFIYVTHDQEEALTMSDRIAVMNGGVLEQVSDTHTLYYQPATKFVADFVGEANLLKGRLTGRDTGEIAGVSVACAARQPAHLPREVDFFIRPEHIRLVPPHEAPLRGVVTEMVFVGATRKYTVQLSDGQTVCATETTLHPAAWHPGTAVGLHWTASPLVFA